jgi:hypothetical protein|tara:strand:- start:831 stop:1223 length:393 start_codon:yes stop_codon:yes gene_type:complete
MDKDKHKYMSDKLLKQQEQAEALRELGERNPDAASAIDNILAAFAPVDNLDKIHEYIQKFESVVSLIKGNIINSKEYNNFSEAEYTTDKKTIFNIKHKVLLLNQIDTHDMNRVNKIYKKHVNIQRILKGT